MTTSLWLEAGRYLIAFGAAACAATPQMEQTGVAEEALSSTLASGASLGAGQSLQNGNYKFTMQNNCLAPVLNTSTNFVVSCTDNTPNVNQSGVTCKMGTDGILRILLGGTTLSCSDNTSGPDSTSATLKLDSSGVLHLVQAGGSSPANDIWTSSPVAGESVPSGWIVP